MGKKEKRNDTSFCLFPHNESPVPMSFRCMQAKGDQSLHEKKQRKSTAFRALLRTQWNLFGKEWHVILLMTFVEMTTDSNVSLTLLRPCS